MKIKPIFKKIILISITSLITIGIVVKIYPIIQIFIGNQNVTNIINNYNIIINPIGSTTSSYPAVLNLMTFDNMTSDLIEHQTYLDYTLVGNIVATVKLPIFANTPIKVATCQCVSGQLPTDCVLFPQFNNTNNALGVTINYTAIPTRAFICP